MSDEMNEKMSMSDFNPLANSTFIEDEGNGGTEPSPDNSAPRTGDDANNEVKSDPLPSSICFHDQTQSIAEKRAFAPTWDVDKIISDSQNIIESLSKLMFQQRRILLLCAFQVSTLKTIQQDLLAPHLMKILRFIMHSNELQVEWFTLYHRMLPPYGDYLSVLKDNPDKIFVDGLPKAVEQTSLFEIASVVTQNMYAGALQLKFQRDVNNEVTDKIEYQTKTTEEDYLPTTNWIELIKSMSNSLEENENKCVDLLSIVDLFNFDRSLTLEK